MEFLKDFLRDLVYREDWVSDKLARSDINGIMIFGKYDEEEKEFFIKIKGEKQRGVFISAKGEDIDKVAEELASKLRGEALDCFSKHLVETFLKG